MFVSIVLLVAFTPFVSINVHDPVAVFSSFFLSAFSLLGLGMCFGCVAVLTREGGAIFVSVQEPIDFLSGLRFPVRILPGVLQAVASILPLTYGIHAARLSLIGGETILRIWFDLLAMAIMGLSFMLFSQYLIALIERRAKKEGTLSLF